MNEVRFVYNPFGQLVTKYQEHGGAVNTGTSLKVEYSYADGSSGTIRPTRVTYPNDDAPLQQQINESKDVCCDDPFWLKS